MKPAVDIDSRSRSAFASDWGAGSAFGGNEYEGGREARRFGGGDEHWMDAPAPGPGPRLRPADNWLEETDDHVAASRVAEQEWLEDDQGYDDGPADAYYEDAAHEDEQGYHDEPVSERPVDDWLQESERYEARRSSEPAPQQREHAPVDDWLGAVEQPPVGETRTIILTREEPQDEDPTTGHALAADDLGWGDLAPNPAPPKRPLTGAARKGTRRPAGAPPRISAARAEREMQAAAVAVAPPAPPSEYRDASGRRTVIVRGHPAEQNESAMEIVRRSARELDVGVRGSHPDRLAAWAVGLGFLLILIAITTAHA